MIITNQLIDLELDVQNQSEVIDKLAERAVKENRLVGKEDYINEIMNREKQVSTDLGGGIAIPHGKTDSVKEPFIAFAKLKTPIVWNEAEQSTVDLIFMLGVPEHSESNLHLRIISQLAAKLMDEDFLEELRNTKDKNFIVDYFNHIRVEG